MNIYFANIRNQIFYKFTILFQILKFVLGNEFASERSTNEKKCPSGNKIASVCSLAGKFRIMNTFASIFAYYKNYM